MPPYNSFEWPKTSHVADVGFPEIDAIVTGEMETMSSGQRVFPLDEGTHEVRGGANDNRSSLLTHMREKAPRPLGGNAKRLFDILIASIGIAMALPIMGVVAACLKLTGGRVFFVHGRIGLNGRAFNCYKFRTMVSDPEGTLEKFLSENPDAAAEWDETQKLRRDPRVTFFGKTLRKSSIDELPQLFNVLRGDMSCVGPRPITAAELSKYGNSVRQYFSCRPGITGLWQVNGRNRLNYDQRVALDTQYVDNWSFRGDVAILLRTIFAVMRFHETS